jgi:hypothetical protein
MSWTSRHIDRTLDKLICDYFEQIVYSINQPTGARNFQAVFWNIAYYDHPYFESRYSAILYFLTAYSSALGFSQLVAKTIHEMVQ